MFHLYNVESSPLPSYVSHPRLPDVVANMKKLRWIYWEGYPASSFPTNFQPTKLGCLILIRGQQTQLWKGRKDLPNLKVLDLRYSCLLTTTPDFNGLPFLEVLILELKKIHPSIGYHERLVYVNMKGCNELKTFPPIIRMKQLETLELSHCFRLQKFPDIQANMDSLVNLHLDETAIEIIPLSVGEFCTNLVSFDLRECSKLKQIEGNFRLLKRLKYLQLSGCDQLEILARDFFDEECCLEELSLAIMHQKSTSSMNFINRIYLQCFHQNTLASPKLPQFPRFLRKLSLSYCNLEDGDIPSDMSGFSNLQVLNLSGNKFSRLHSNLSQIPHLKLLNLSYCIRLVELPDLPLSLAILIANGCESLQSVGDLSNNKWLWKVFLEDCKKLNEDPERLLNSMLQVNAIENRFMSVRLPNGPLETYESSDLRNLTTLQLPHNWHGDFRGILLWSCNQYWEPCTIVLKPEILTMESQVGHPEEESDKSPKSYEYKRVGYVPFDVLTHASWWNSSFTNISVEIQGAVNPKVVFVPKNRKLGDSKERPEDCSEFWDEEYQDIKTFEILDDSKSSSIQIVWSHT